MITTFTSPLIHNEKKQEKEAGQFPVIDTPSDQTIDFILNYSKNLQVSKSRFVKEIEVIKS
jgi:hypothetical protein